MVSPLRPGLDFEGRLFNCLASGNRCSELHALTRSYKSVYGESRGVPLIPDISLVSKTQVKTSNLGALKPVFIPYLESASGTGDVAVQLLCPVKSIEYYVQRSDV